MVNAAAQLATVRHRAKLNGLSANWHDDAYQFDLADFFKQDFVVTHF